MPGRTTSIRHDIPRHDPGALESLAHLVGGASQGFLNAKMQQQKDMVSLLPVLAQMKMLKTGGKKGDPGTITLGNMTFTIGEPGEDAQDALARAKTKETLQDIGEQDRTKLGQFEHTMEMAMKDPSYKEAVETYGAESTEANAAYSGSLARVRRQYELFDADAPKGATGELASEYANYSEDQKATLDIVGQSDDGKYIYLRPKSEEARAKVEADKKARKSEMEALRKSRAQTGKPDYRGQSAFDVLSQSPFGPGLFDKNDTRPPTQGAGQATGRFIGDVYRDYLGGAANLGQLLYETPARLTAGGTNLATGMFGGTGAPVSYNQFMGAGGNNPYAIFSPGGVGGNKNFLPIPRP